MKMKVEQLTEINGTVVNESEFNSRAKGWSVKLSRNMRQNIASGANSSQSKGKLRESIKSNYSFQQKVIYRVGFGFERYGIFRAYGVGKGYIHSPYGVIRGRRTAEYYKKSRKNKSQFVAYGKGGMNRSPLDWFDSEIKDNIDGLADIVAEFYGDSYVVNNNVLNQLTIK
jgi:hypothetical protein